MMLKSVKLKGEDFEYLILTSAQELSAYAELLQESFLQETARYLKHTVEEGISEYDYLPTNTIGGNEFKGGIRYSMNYKNPLLEASRLVSSKPSNLIKHINNGEIILLNKNGGFRFLSDVDVIEDTFEYQEQLNNIEINPDSKVLVLENDPDLEPAAVKKYPNSSYVTRLRSVNTQALFTAMEKFKRFGGEKLYVLTTGRDEDQLKWYMDIAISAGIVCFELEFNNVVDRSVLVEYENNKNIEFSMLGLD